VQPLVAPRRIGESPGAFIMDVDFAIDSFEKARQSLQSGDVTAIVHRGMRIILDKDAKMERLMAQIAAPSAPRPPTQPEFLNVVNDFWYHAVWTAKKLRRGELWTAKSCCDSYMKHLLRQMVEWHTQATNNGKRDTWHNGRFLEQWADPRVVEELRNAYARYDKNEVKRALFVTTALFRWLATETAESLTYPYPFSGDEYASELTKALLAQQLS
jgi:aminoglycoside 6-adenylyltransferase